MSVPREIKLYRARTILTMASQPIEDGALAVLGSEIIDVGRWSDLLAEHSTSVREDLGDVILMPGLIQVQGSQGAAVLIGCFSGCKRPPRTKGWGVSRKRVGAELGGQLVQPPVDVPLRSASTGSLCQLDHERQALAMPPPG